MTQNYTRHGRSPVSKEHLRQLDCLDKAYNQEGIQRGIKDFIGQRFNS